MTKYYVSYNYIDKKSGELGCGARYYDKEDGWKITIKEIELLEYKLIKSEKNYEQIRIMSIIELEE